MADVLRDQHDQHRQGHQHGRDVELRTVELRQADPRGVGDRLQRVLAQAARQGREQPADEHADEDGKAREQAAGGHGDHHNRQQRYRRDPGLGFHVRHRGRRQVEADERDDGAGDHGRHHRVDDAFARPFHDDTDKDERHTGQQHPAQLRADAILLRSRQRSDKGEGRTQVAGHSIAGDQQEDDGAQPGEQQRGVHRESGQGGHQQCGSEHCNHVLHADADGARPAQPLVRGDNSPGAHCAPVSVNGPAESVSHEMPLSPRHLNFPVPGVPGGQSR